MKKLVFVTMCLLAALSATAVDTFYINDFVINPGETKQVEINLDNELAYTALQADIYLPEGLTIEQEDGDYLFVLTDRKGNNHTVSSTQLSSGAIRILIASQTLKTFKGNSGALVTFNIIADASFTGPKTLEMKNIIATDSERNLHYFANQETTVSQESVEPPTPTGENDRLYIDDFSISAGGTKQVEINLDNELAYTALQADIYLPEGLTIEQEDGDYLFVLTDRKGNNHTVSSTQLSSGAIRILIASQTLKTFSGNSGALVTFNIIADGTFTGPKTLEMKNIIATDSERNLHYFPDQETTVSQESVEPPTPTGENDRLYIDDFSISAGGTKQVEINLDNELAYTALQADIYLPEGLTIEQEDGDYLFVLTDRKGNNHTVSSTQLSSGAIRILIASQTLKTFSGNSGALVTFNIIADASFTGPKTLEMKNIIATDSERNLHYFANQETTVSQESVEPPTPTGENDRLYIDDFSISAGGTKQVEINLDNELAYTALQADIYLPEGLTIEQEDGDYLFVLTDRKGNNHTVSSTQLSSGAIRILIASQTLKTFKGNSGALVTFNIIADGTFTGPKTLEMKNIIATDSERNLHYFPDQETTVSQESVEPPTPIDEEKYNLFFDAGYIVQGFVNQTTLVPLKFQNTRPMTAFSVTVKLNERILLVDDINSFIEAGERGENFTFTATQNNDGTITINGTSSTPLEAGEGVVLNLKVKTQWQNNYKVPVTNMTITTIDGTVKELPDSETLLILQSVRGDMNGDGRVDLSDALYIINLSTGLAE